MDSSALDLGAASGGPEDASRLSPEPRDAAGVTQIGGSDALVIGLGDG